LKVKSHWAVSTPCYSTKYSHSSPKNIRELISRVCYLETLFLMQKLRNLFIELWFFKSKAVEFKLCFAELWGSTDNFQGFGRQVIFVMKLTN